MAERRMLAKSITDSDEFTALSSAAQALYMHLNLGADDDGFNNQIQLAMFKAHASVDDLKILLAKRYVMQFDNGVIVVRHWRVNNLLRGDRKKDTSYQDFIKQLFITENGEYESVDNQLTTKCQPTDNQVTPQVRLGKDSIGKDSILPPYNPPLAEKETVLSVIENYSAYGKIVSLLKEFVELRQKKKKPLTVRAIKMALNELDKLAGNDDGKKEAIINQTILHAWDSFYQLKGEPKTNLSHEEFIAQTAARILAKQKAEKERRLNGC